MRKGIESKLNEKLFRLPQNIKQKRKFCGTFIDGFWVYNVVSRRFQSVYTYGFEYIFYDK